MNKIKIKINNNKKKILNHTLFIHNITITTIKSVILTIIN